ncbi:MAG TPA: hypothetical protein DIW81_12825 [Planctomycetaceae bacterium]|nr:hypothetical protein [Rubinisphaera sp.]HCS52456.1 hypothetical protein [Planctomycetaceae bacterium]
MKIDGFLRGNLNFREFDRFVIPFRLVTYCTFSEIFCTSKLKIDAVVTEIPIKEAKSLKHSLCG